MKLLRLISRIAVGLLFIFSGTVKAIDPMGTIIKLEDYFLAFGIDFLKPLALILTIILCTAEFIAGFTVLFNLRNAKGIWLVIIMMAIFTPLTFILALTNPVSDCGCFGDAVKLTNWQTFFKNLIILVPSLFLFIAGEKAQPESRKKDLIITAMAGTAFIIFIFYNKTFLPVIDFLPYKTGTYIPEKMVIPEGAEPDKYETTFIYQKDGKKTEFTLENYPAGDTTWKFVEQKSVLVSKGYLPPIHDFRITSAADNSDLTENILNTTGYVFLMIADKINEADTGRLEAGYELGRVCLESGAAFYVLTSSGSETVNSINNGLSFCFVDETTLKTIVRSNPGYVLLKGGTIMGKWSWAGVPGKDELKELINK